MDNKEILEAIKVLNETLKTLNPHGLFIMKDESDTYKMYVTVIRKIEHLTSMPYTPIIGELKV